MTKTIALDHVIAYGADGGLDEIKSKLREFGFVSSSADRTDIGHGVHAAYFRLGDIVMELFSVFDPAEFRSAKETMPFAEGLRRTQAVFAIGYGHNDLESVSKAIRECGVEVREPYTTGTEETSRIWKHLILDDIFSGTAPFLSSYAGSRLNDKAPLPADRLGLRKVEEIWFATDRPRREAELWKEVFSVVAPCDMEIEIGRATVQFEGRRLCWMTADRFSKKTGKPPARSHTEKYGQLSAFVMSEQNPADWRNCLARSRFPTIDHGNYVGVHLDRGLDIKLLTRKSGQGQ